MTGFLEKREKKTLLLLFVLCLIIRSIVFSQGGNHAGDGMYRTILTINFLKDPYFISADLWPPLHLYMMSFLTLIFNDPFISTRLVSLVFGTLIIFPYYYLVKLLFDIKTALISTIILIFTDLYIYYSTYAMAEIPLAFFITTSIYFLFRFERQTQKLSDLIISSLFLSLSTMTRYEAWLFIPLMTVFIVLDNLALDKNIIGKLKRNLINKNIFIFIIISSVFPIFWMIGNYQLYGDIFYSQSWSDNWIKTNALLRLDDWHNPPLFKKLVIWPAIVFNTLGVVSIFAGIGMLVSLLKKERLEFLSIFSILLIVFTYKFMNFTMLQQPRHMILAMLFFIPYFNIGLVQFIKNDKSDKLDVKTEKVAVIIVLVFLTLYAINTSYTVISKNDYITPKYVFDVSDWIKNNVKSNDTILLDEYKWWGLHILYFSGLNTTFTEYYLQTFEYKTDQIIIVAGGGKKIDEDVVINYLRDSPTYLIYSPSGKLGILNFSKECKKETRFNYSFECKYSTDNYNIYKIEKEKDIR